MVAVVRKCFQLISPERRWRWLVLIILALVATGLEMLGAALVYTVMALVANPTGAIDVPLIGDLRDLIGGLEQSTLLLAVAGVMGAFFILRAVAQIPIGYVQQRVAQREGARLANKLTAGYLALPYAFQLCRNTADLIRNVNGAIGRIVTQGCIPIIQVAADSVLVVGLLVVMVIVSPLATVSTIVVVGGSAVLLLFIVQPRLKRLGLVTHKIGKTTLKSLQQALHGLRDVKLLGREEAFTALRISAGRPAALRGRSHEVSDRIGCALLGGALFRDRGAGRVEGAEGVEGGGERVTVLIGEQRLELPDPIPTADQGAATSPVGAALHQLEALAIGLLLQTSDLIREVLRTASARQREQRLPRPPTS